MPVEPQGPTRHMSEEEILEHRMAIIHMLGAVSEGASLPSVSVDDLGSDLKRIFLESIQDAKKLNPDAVTSYHLGLSR